MIKISRLRFSLVELLVVVAIIAILVSILLPVLSRARKQSRIVHSMNNLKQIHAAAFMYADNNDQYFCRSSEADDQKYDYPRYYYESMSGIKFSSDRNTAKEEMAGSSYEDMFFCPLQRSVRGPAKHHGNGRTDYGMNKYFNRKARVKLTRLAGKGKIEPFIVPGNAMNSTQTQSTIGNTSYDASSADHANYDYFDKTLGLYIDGSVKPFTIGHGEYINPWFKSRNDFE
ncbi:type II secretion system protein [Lentisphaera marina]|uniref:type II secretion system protein n=1 Tax=Lentisphaera marina TaxID=1111041 RepID=UPI0023656289|nr:type II secretion system protein [Lentisphaera marina]MDD7986572.1 type II secretion system protein [Lentisphaera marina]